MMAIICHWRPRKVRSRVGLAEKALVEIQGTERPTALANSARSATARFLEASQAATGRFRIQSQQAALQPSRRKLSFGAAGGTAPGPVRTLLPVSAHECRRHRVLSESLPQYRPVHRLIT
jgi:hypothetical protein